MGASAYENNIRELMLLALELYGWSVLCIRHRRRPRRRSHRSRRRCRRRRRRQIWYEIVHHQRQSNTLEGCVYSTF